MPLYMLIKVEGHSASSGHRENVGLFDSEEKALSAQASLEMGLFDGGSLEGISFYIEEWFAK